MWMLQNNTVHKEMSPNLNLNPLHLISNAMMHRLEDLHDLTNFTYIKHKKLNILSHLHHYMHTMYYFSITRSDLIHFAKFKIAANQ